MGHLHSEQVKEEHGVKVRNLSSVTATDSWHYTSGYVGAIATSQSFVWDKERGLKGDMVFTGKGRPKLVIGVDFDQTIAKTKYPTIIKPKFLAIPVLKWLKRRHTIILWTCRVDKHLDSAVDWCDKQGVSFHHINNNCFDRIKKYGGDCRKTVL